MNLADEIRQQMEKNKGLKLAVGEINNHLSILEGLARKDITERVDEAYQKGFEEGKAVNDKGCEGCKYAVMGSDTTICDQCCNGYHNQWTAKDDKIEVGDEVEWEGVNFTVLRVFTPKGCYEQCDGFDCDGNGYTNILTKDVTKTNRHFDISSILKEMQS
jgi:hypothetical protein